MRTAAFSLLAFATLSLFACNKTDDGSNTNTGTGSGSGSNTAVPAANTFVVDGTKYSFYSNQSDVIKSTTDTSYVVLFKDKSDNGAFANLIIQYKGMNPPASGTYKPFNWKNNPKTNPITTGEVAVTAQLNATPRNKEFFSTGDGTVTITNNGGKISCAFTGLPAFKADTATSIIQLSANMTQQ